MAENALDGDDIVCLEEVPGEGAPEVVPGQVLDAGLGDPFVEDAPEGFAGQA